MIIEKIVLNRFKKFENLEVALLQGLNVIKGPNEAGKSTLHSAVIAGLFFDPSHRRAEIKSNISWYSDKMYEISLTINENGKGYTLSKDFENKRIQISENGLRQEITDTSIINRKLCDWLGFSSISAFRSTVCIEQDKISQVTKGEKEIGEILQSTITGEDDATANSLIEWLTGVVSDESNESEKSGEIIRPVKELSGMISDLENEYTAAKTDANKASISNARLLEIEERLNEIDSLLHTKTTLKKKNDTRRAFQSELRIIEEKFAHASNALKLHEEILALGQRLSAYKPFFKLTDEDIETFHSLLGKKQSLEELQNSLQEQLNQPKQKVIQKRPKLNPVFIGGVIVLWIGLIGTILTKFMLILAFVGLVALCGGIILMLSKSEVQIELSPSQIRNQISHANDQINFIDENIKYFLSRTKTGAVKEFIEKQESYKPLKKRQIEKESELLGMIGEESIEKVKREFEELSRRKDKIKDELGKLDPFVLDSEGYQRTLDETEKLGKEKAGLEAEKRELEITVANVKTTDADLATLQERLAGLRQKMEFYEHRRLVYENCLSFLQMARRKTLRSATNVLEEEIERHLGTITGNRYRKVRVDKETLNLLAYSQDKNDYVDVQNLSRATIDQIYLAARLGLVKLVSGNKKPPLLLDDPFVTFDDKRLEATMQLIIEVAKEYQVLLFTCTDRYDQYADKVVDLRTYSFLNNSSKLDAFDETRIEPVIIDDAQPIQEQPPNLEQ